jgi:hypothetical protein
LSILFDEIIYHNSCSQFFISIRRIFTTNRTVVDGLRSTAISRLSPFTATKTHRDLTNTNVFFLVILGHYRSNREIPQVYALA